MQVAAIQAEVTKQQKESEGDLAKAEPALQAANAALNTLNRVSMCVSVRDWGRESVIVQGQRERLHHYCSLLYVFAA